MRVFAFFLLVAIAVYAFRTLRRKERRQAIKFAGSGVIPFVLALTLTAFAVFFALNFNGKII